MARFILILIVTIVALNLVDLAKGTFVRPDEWNDYKATYQKTYLNPMQEGFAKLCYAVNKNWIRQHNALYDRGLKTYRLAVNQFTDMRFIHFKALFPPSPTTRSSNAKPAPPVQEAAASYDPRDMGFELNIEDQGIKCNSGWAYAAAKSMELFKALESGSSNSSSYSAQNLIDCAGGSNACYNQIPQAAFDYLTQRKMNLYLEKDYKNQNNRSQPGKCRPPTTGDQQFEVANLTAYSKIRRGDVGSLEKYVSAGMPVVVEFNPGSFEFMHYSEGIFQQPRACSGSHYMVVVGYGTDENTNENYWLLINSFGTTWGEGGLMRLRRTRNDLLTRNAIFPSES